MKIYTMIPVLLLTGCGGITKEDFFQDEQNMKKSIDITSKRQRTSDCDKLGLLNDFVHIENPKLSDLEKIMPILNLHASDAKNVNKLYKLNYSVIDTYSCKDNKKEITNEVEQYCRDKYYDEYTLETLFYFPFRLVSAASVFTIVGAIPFAIHSCGVEESAMHPIMCNKKQDCDKYLMDTVQIDKNDYSKINKNKLKEQIKQKIEAFYPLPNADSHIVKWFEFDELIEAGNTIIGKFDTGCVYDCETTKENVTRLRGAEILFNRCQWEIGYTMDADELLDTCGCFAHKVYKNADFKNILFVHEKNQFLPSTRLEYLKQINNCKTKVKKMLKNSEIERYGEASENYEFSDAFGQIITETLENAAWAHKTITDTRKKAEQRSKNK